MTTQLQVLWKRLNDNADGNSEDFDKLNPDEVEALEVEILKMNHGIDPIIENAIREHQREGTTTPEGGAE